MPRLVAGSGQRREKADVLIEIFVLPFPLIAGDFEGQFGVTRIFDVDQHARCGYGQRDQDQDGYDGPDDFCLGAVHQRGVGHRAVRFTETNNRVQHPAKHEDADGDAHPENQHVQVIDFLAEIGHTDAHVKSPVCVCEWRTRRNRNGGERRKPGAKLCEHVDDLTLLSSNHSWAVLATRRADRSAV